MNSVLFFRFQLPWSLYHTEAMPAFCRTVFGKRISWLFPHFLTCPSIICIPHLLHIGSVSDKRHIINHLFLILLSMKNRLNTLICHVFSRFAMLLCRNFRSASMHSTIPELHQHLQHVLTNLLWIVARVGADHPQSIQYQESDMQLVGQKLQNTR